MDPSLHSSAPVGRRAAVTAIGAALAAGLSACAGPETAVSEPPPGDPDQVAAASWGSASATPSPAPSKQSRRRFIPDYRIPPVQNGLAPVITRIPTQHPVVFLTIDDGITKTPETAALMAESGLPATLFLTRNFVRDNPAFFKAFQAQGSLVENHTMSHNTNMVRQMSYDQQLAEITGMQTYAEQQFGRRPTLFRPPAGAYSNVMRKAVADAGLQAIITWEAKANAGHMDYQVGNALRPGDIVLMHFRPEFAADMAAFRQAQLAAGLEVVLLEDFLQVA
ncbi:polysaccharide deacetylase family protein [Pseudarthrobacter sp. TAF60_1]|uniref:polysaccharide deacetylase family protein n=1 Tax=Pseudarthrobacter sp. TAF60_1 TaxID=3233071 RepID=UPI003F991B0B